MCVKGRRASCCRLSGTAVLSLACCCGAGCCRALLASLSARGQGSTLPLNSPRTPTPLNLPPSVSKQFFATKTDASALRMLAGSPAERLLKPIADYIEARGGRIHTRWGCRCAV